MQRWTARLPSACVGYVCISRPATPVSYARAAASRGLRFVNGCRYRDAGEQGPQSHCRRVLERAAVLQVGGDAGRAERMVANGRADAHRQCAASDHRIGIRLRQRLGAELPRAAPDRAEQRASRVVMCNLQQALLSIPIHFRCPRHQRRNQRR